MDPHRGVRGTISRYLNDGSPNPVYVVEWPAGLQTDFMTGGALSVTKEVLKQVEGLKKGYLKYYCKFSNILASQKDYTVAAYQYMLSLGVMAKGDFICVNHEVHSDYQGFDTELEMRAHWEKCHKIALTEKFNMFVLPDSRRRQLSR